MELTKGSPALFPGLRDYFRGHCFSKFPSAISERGLGDAPIIPPSQINLTLREDNGSAAADSARPKIL